MPAKKGSTNSALWLVKLIMGFIGLLVAGCSSFSTLQSARTVPEGSYRMFMGGGLFLGTQSNSAVHDINSSGSYFSTFTELGGRVGMMRYLDMGAKLIIPGGAQLDGKYQLVDEGILAMAVGLQLGYMNMRTTSGGTSRYSNLFDAGIAIYQSLDFSEWVGGYSAVKYVYRKHSGYLDGWSEYFAASGGLRLGNTIGILAEATIIKQMGGDYLGIQFGGAFFFGSAPFANYYVRPKHWEQMWEEKWVEKYLEDPHDQDAARVIHISARRRVVTVSHERLRAWKPGDRVCIFKKGRKIGCGTVTKINSEGGAIKMSRARGEILPGMLVKEVN